MFAGFLFVGLDLGFMHRSGTVHDDVAVHRQAYAALCRVVIVRMRAHQLTLDYVKRRTAEGKSKPEIIRCLKRYVASENFGNFCRLAHPLQAVTATP